MSFLKAFLVALCVATSSAMQILSELVAKITFCALPWLNWGLGVREVTVTRTAGMSDPSATTAQVQVRSEFSSPHVGGQPLGSMIWITNCHKTFFSFPQGSQMCRVGGLFLGFLPQNSIACWFTSKIWWLLFSSSAVSSSTVTLVGCGAQLTS